MLVVGAKLSDYRELAGRMPHGETVPAACSTPDVVLEGVGPHVELAWPPHGVVEPVAAGSTVMHAGRRWGPTHERLTAPAFRGGGAGGMLMLTPMPLQRATRRRVS